MYFLCHEYHHYARRGGVTQLPTHLEHKLHHHVSKEVPPWKPYRRVVDSMWLGYMASHKYFNYTGLINTPLCKVKTSFAKRKWFGYGIN